MIFYPLGPEADEQCGFELAKDGKMGRCGATAVVGCSVPLCREHVEYAVSMTHSTLKARRGDRCPIPSWSFWELVDASVKARGELAARKKERGGR